MKKISLLGMCLMLTGCWMGCRFPFTEYGDVTVHENQLCINGKVGDVLSFYNLSSSKNQYNHPLLFLDDKDSYITYPNICLDVVLEGGYTYSFNYKLDKKTYQFEFTKDLNGNIVILRGVK